MRLLDTKIKRAVQNKINPLLAKISITYCKPTSIHFSITNRCSLSCKHCDIWDAEKSKKELSTENVEGIINDLRNWLGPFSLNIAGGEPFIRRDMIRIIEHCTQQDIEVNVTTNATLISKNLAKKILNSGLKTINISLDSMNPRLHDYIRNKEGTFKKVMNAINYLSTNDRKLCIVIATVLIKQNCEELKYLTSFVKQNNLNGVIFQPLFQNFGTIYNPYWYKNNEFWPDDYRLIEKALEYLIKDKTRQDGSPVVNSVKQLNLLKYYFKDHNQKTKQRCAVGVKNFCINEYGDALLCFWLPPIGNLLEEKPATLWASENAKKRRMQIGNCDRNCKLLNCHFD